MSAQALQALEIANRRRMAGVAIRAEIAALPMADGLRRVADLLDDPDEEVGALRTDRLLTAPHRFGTSKVSQLCIRAPGFQPTRRLARVRDLTRRERLVLATALRRYADGR